jgi:SAM-dependent methyltransferase
MDQYIHGYSVQESSRLNDQANTLDNLLHHDTTFQPGDLILEAGCGVGAQTNIIASKNSYSQFISVDISEDSLTQAKQFIESQNIENVLFRKADIYNLPFCDALFNHVFVCFVLEHLANPEAALAELKRVLIPQGTITVIEGDHGSTFFYPDCVESQKAIHCQEELQKRNGGNAHIGRELYPLLDHAGFVHIDVSPRMVYVDNSRPSLVEGFTKNTFTAMIEGVKSAALENKLVDESTFDEGIKGLYRTTAPDGVFCYTFFKARAIKYDS